MVWVVAPWCSQPALGADGYRENETGMVDTPQKTGSDNYKGSDKLSWLAEPKAAAGVAMLTEVPAEQKHRLVSHRSKGNVTLPRGY